MSRVGFEHSYYRGNHSSRFDSSLCNNNNMLLAVVLLCHAGPQKCEQEGTPLLCYSFSMWPYWGVDLVRQFIYSTCTLTNYSVILWSLAVYIPWCGGSTPDCKITRYVWSLSLGKLSNCSYDIYAICYMTLLTNLSTSGSSSSPPHKVSICSQ